MTVESTTEKCALCGKDTGVRVDTPILLREHFIEESGQLCEDCYRELAKNKPWHNLA